MQFVEVHWQPADRSIRQFVAIAFLALPTLSWLAGWGLAITAVFAGLGSTLLVVGWISPDRVKPLYLVLTLIAVPIGWVVGEVLLFTIYVLVFVPFALVFRCLGRDALQRGFRQDQSSYWESKKQPTQVSSYYRQS